MKNAKILTACITLTVAAGLCAAGICMMHDDYSQLTNEDFIRLHVVANSDSEKDQALKLKVRDRIIEYVDDSLVREAVRNDDGKSGSLYIGIEDSRRFITDNLDEIVNVAKKTVAEEGFELDVSAEYGVGWIPEKTYGDVVFPAGNYEALRILIGEGAGQNWWCVLYPPLCLIDAGEYEEYEVLRDAVMQGKYSQLLSPKMSGLSGSGGADNPEKQKVLKIKFKTVEIIKRFSD